MRASSSTFNSKPRARSGLRNVSGGRIFTGVLFIALIITYTLYIGRVYEAAAAKNKLNVWNKSRFEDFYALKRDTVDMVFIGSSHSYCTFDPETVDRLLGTYSYQMGMPLQGPDSSYYTLLEVFNYQSPETVVLELYWELLGGGFDPKQLDGLFQVMNNPALKRDYIRNGLPLGSRLMYYLKPIRFQADYLAYINNRLLEQLEDSFGLVKKTQDPDGMEFYKSRGFIFCDYVMSANEYDTVLNGSEYDGYGFKISGSQAHYIKKIIELCRAKNSRLIFVTAPVSNVRRDKIVDYADIHGAIEAIAVENNIPYLDFNNIETIFDDSDFRDKNHLNYMGMKKACEYFAGFIDK